MTLLDKARRTVDMLTREGFADIDRDALAKRKGALPIEESPRIGREDLSIYVRSLQRDGEVLFGMLRLPSTRELFALAPAKSRHHVPSIFEQVQEIGDTVFACAPLTVDNAYHVHRLFPFTRPISLRDKNTTIGMGDRLGVATPGHVRVARRFKMSPVLAQQSVRENEFIGRNFRSVVADATWGVFQEGFEDGYAGDGDHLKNIPWIDVALEAKMPMITLDLTEVMRPEVADFDSQRIEREFQDLEAEFRERVLEAYAGKRFDVEGEEISLEEIEAKLCAVMYGPALAFSEEVNRHLSKHTGDSYDLEISIDETTTPTLPEHHFFIARELQVRGVKVNSVAPRFIGEFQKGVEYIGDIAEFERQFRTHARIARANGYYKVSVHSGSDKLTVYPIVGRETGMKLHLKTAGTSWLEALRAMAIHEPSLYRELHAKAIEKFEDALNHYVVSADFSAIPDLDSVADASLPGYLDDNNARQMLHISYGGILQDKPLAQKLFEALHRREEEYAQLLVAHFSKHLDALGVARSE